MTTKTQSRPAATKTLVLVATKETQGRRKNDYSHATEGEIVTFGMECDRESVDGKCGCKRALVGTESLKATTTMRVEARDLTEAQLAEIVYKGLEKGGWTKIGTEAENRKWAADNAHDLLDVARAFHVGDVVEKRGGTYYNRPTDAQLKEREERLAKLNKAFRTVLADLRDPEVAWDRIQQIHSDAFAIIKEAAAKPNAHARVKKMQEAVEALDLAVEADPECLSEPPAIAVKLMAKARALIAEVR